MFQDIVLYFLTPIVAFIFLMLVFIPMEQVFPAIKGQKTFRPHWKLDFLYFLGQYLIFGTILILLVSSFNNWVYNSVSFRIFFLKSNIPLILQIFIVLFLSDFLIYWAHRLQHTIPILWRFHKIHHSSEHLDWLASYREHPIDSLYTIGIINLPIILLGFPSSTIAGVIAFRGIWAIYIHSNVRLNIGPLKYLIGSPEIHHWHHHKNKFVGNYANISPLMDIIFGTFYCNNDKPIEFGTQEPIKQNYLTQLFFPLLPNKLIILIINKINAKK